jgi:uncharacterized protein
MVFMRRPLSLMALFLALAATGGTARAASFDCGQASAPDEKMVCADPQLSELDSRMGEAFTQAKATAPDEQLRAEVIAMARQFLKDRRACGVDLSCVIATYTGAIQRYQNAGASVAMPAWVTAVKIAAGRATESAVLPAQIGQCTETAVKVVGPRLYRNVPPSDPSYFAMGTAVGFTNGGSQVSYDPEPGIIGSKPGDRVLMCLISLPRNCPPGDERGKFYMVTNLRTKANWLLPDSQHNCGGA